MFATSGGYCDAHQSEREEKSQEYHREYDERSRDKESAKFYHSAGWKATRERVLQERPICQNCNQQMAVHVHHIDVLKENRARGMDLDNLLALCAGCHSAIEHRRGKK